MSLYKDLKDEIWNLKESLKQLELERRNLVQHLNIQEDNYAATFKTYVEKAELLIKKQEDKIDELLREQTRLEAVILRCDSPVLQYRF